MNEKLDKINKRIDDIKISEDYIKFIIILMNTIKQTAEVIEDL